MYLEQDLHGVAGVSRVQQQQLVFRAGREGGEGAAETRIPRLALEEHTHVETHTLQHTQPSRRSGKHNTHT